MLSYYMREKLGRKLEAFTTAALNNIGLTAQHRDFDLPDSHSGTDVWVTEYNAVIECKNLALDPKHRCGYKWALTKIVNRFTLNDGKTHILVISYIDQLSQRAQALLEALGIHIVQVGIQVAMHNTLATTIGRLHQTKLATTIKNLLTNILSHKITTLNYIEYPYTGSLETVYEPLRGLNSITITVNQLSYQPLNQSPSIIT